MKSNRNRAFSKDKNTSTDVKVGKPLFPIVPILINIIAIVVLSVGYYYASQNYIFADYQTYIYWAVNVLITYNIVAASAKSLIAPILALLVALVSIYLANTYNINFLSYAEFWQLIIVSVIGFLISIMLRL
jgi:hypothetical protein